MEVTGHKVDFDLVVNTIALPELAPRFEGLPTDVAADIADDLGHEAFGDIIGKTMVLHYD